MSSSYTELGQIALSSCVWRGLLKVTVSEEEEQEEEGRIPALRVAWQALLHQSATSFQYIEIF